MFVFFSKEYSQACTLGLLSLCLHAWSSVVTSPPGGTVSLNCLYSTNSSSDGSSMLWYRQLSGRPPEPILRSFSPDDTFSYSYLRAGEHFTLEKNHTLVIRNVTREDAATYYCSKLEADKCRFGDGIELRVDGHSSTPITPAEGPKTLVYVFLALSVLFNLLLFLCIATENKWFPFRNPKKTELQQPCHENDLHYAEVRTTENQQRRGQEKIHIVYAEVQLRK
ncbi:uncharacterized protein LOC114641173 [Erpetoichthys calabaricus]|uniref:uncharacterized protein LOC114641173 n=1 Tax=Erpetoichthys calabaricus TaxID=27687 RepID=UPI00223494F7|nr:uncharacterized protein LOC114641173 [Erpetoichthys calabaricus]